MVVRRKKYICKTLRNYSKRKQRDFFIMWFEHAWFFKETVILGDLIIFITWRFGPICVVSPSLPQNSRFINKADSKVWIRKDFSTFPHKYYPFFTKIFLTSMTIWHCPISYIDYYFIFEIFCFIDHWLRYSCAKILKTFVDILFILGMEMAVEICISMNGLLWMLLSKIDSQHNPRNNN